MARFFIDRPVFAWVLAIFIILAGVLAIPRLAVERYPAVAPPSVSIYASYPGASPQTLSRDAKRRVVGKNRNPVRSACSPRL